MTFQSRRRPREARMTTCRRLRQTQRTGIELLGNSVWTDLVLPSGSKGIGACQKALVQAMQKYHAQGSKVLRKCWAARDKGKYSDIRQDASAGAESRSCWSSGGGVSARLS